MYSAAIDPRIDAALVSGYFDRRQNVWREPIDRNVWSLLREFGDAEIAGLIVPRGLVIESAGGTPPVDAKKNDRLEAYPTGKGELPMPQLESVLAEVDRVALGGKFVKPTLVASDAGPFSDDAVSRLTTMLGVKSLAPRSNEKLTDRRTAFDAAARHLRYVKELEGHVQRLLQRSDKVRDEAFLFKVMPELAGVKWSKIGRAHV